MGLTVRRENDFGSLFDKLASLPDDVEKTVKQVAAADDKNKARDQKKKTNKKRP